MKSLSPDAITVASVQITKCNGVFALLPHYCRDVFEVEIMPRYRLSGEAKRAAVTKGTSDNGKSIVGNV